MENDNRSELDRLADEVQEDAKKVDDIRDRAKQHVQENAEETGPDPAVDPETSDDSGEEYDIFKVIVDSIMKVVQDPTVKRAFESLKDRFNRLGSGDATDETGDISKELIEVISMSVSYTVVMAINYYDYQLKQALSRDFQDVNEVFTRIESDLLATTMKVGKLEKLMAEMKLTSE